MKKTDNIQVRIIEGAEILKQANRWRLNSKTIAFTNGVFDILHEGHLTLLSKAATFADILVVGVNSDASVKRLKGENRPVNNENSRALLLASLIMVDAVIIFDEDTPLELILKLEPDVLIKGGDYSVDTIVGAKETLAKNGSVEIIPIVEGFSTTGIIEKIAEKNK
ncbi:MAG: D-glycero-beta-D-manno-heptose 1-phosphate adenylyltransferase [Ginsengibacter sp.]